MSRITRICVARHGETDWNAAGILQGWLDVTLNDRGKQQAHAFSKSLGDLGFSCIYTSPLRRSLETAAILADGLGLATPICHDGLMERNFGVIQGRPKEELRITHPELLEQILRRNPTCVFEGGESLDRFATRVLSALTDIAQDKPGQTVLVITHGWVMDAITRHIRNLPDDTVLNMKRKNMECIWLDVTPESIMQSRQPAGSVATGCE